MNFKTKKAMKKAFDDGQTIEVYQPGGNFEGQSNGEVAIEGPHYPAPHSWYASVLIKDREIVKIIS